MNFKYEAIGFSSDTELKLDYAIDVFKNIYIGDQNKIKSFIINHKKYDGSIGFDQTEDNNVVVLEKFFSDIPIWIKFKADYKRFGSARAYTYPNSNEIYLRVNKIDFDNTADLVNTIAHEYAHKKNLVHSFKYSHLWKTTAPYGIGQCFEDICNSHFENKPPSNKSPKVSFLKKIFRRFF